MPLTEMTTAIKRLLPSGIVLLTGKIHLYQKPLTKEEEQLIQGAAVHRIREFTAGRAIAKDAMQLLGTTQYSIGRNEDGCPVWPFSVVGSISHKGGLCGAIVADSRLYESVGFDIEFTEDLNQAMWETFASQEEMRQATACDMEQASFANILFSAKEAHFKALYPILGSSTPSLDKINLTVKKHNNHLVTSFSCNDNYTQGGLIHDLKACLAWAISIKNV